MAQMKEILPKGDYTIKTVGPNREWEFNGNKMISDTVQLEGHEQYWVDVNRAADKPAPKAGDVLKGHVEQDDAGKFAPKFKKEQSGNGWRGGAPQSSPGAIWATAMQTAAVIVAGYYNAAGTKPTDIKDYFNKVKALAPKVNATVDAFVTADKKKVETKPADTAASESGESPAKEVPAIEDTNVVIEDISDEELGEW